MFEAPSFDTQSTEPSMVTTSSITPTTSVSDHAPGTTSTPVSNGANSSGAFSVGAIIGISVGSVLIGIAISIRLVFMRFVRSGCSSIMFVVNTLSAYRESDRYCSCSTADVPLIASQHELGIHCYADA